MYDLIIIGGGPAGVAGGVYAARKKMKTLVITDSFGGQSLVSDSIENWIGTKSISGWDLAKKLEEHLRAQEDIEILEEKATGIAKKEGAFYVQTNSDKEFGAKTILLCTGGRHRKLNVPGEEKFEGKGVVYCSTCDAPLFKGKEVAVIGGGNAGLEAVIDLIPYASKITLIVRSGQVKGDPVTFEEIKKSEKVDVIYNADTTEIMGDILVSGIKYKELETSEEKELPVEGVFVEIGTMPNSDIVKDIVDLDERGSVKIECKTGMSSVPGIWAAGDVSDVLYKQNNIAAGDAVRAVLNIYSYLRDKGK
ncbi:MAG: FAD-dependent oxidoreductase [Candidatus Paceibacterota bacterium]